MTRKFSTAQTNYMKAKAWHDTITDIVEKCKAKVLTENVFYAEPMEGEHRPRKAERILKTNADFMMSSDDFEKYCKLCYAEYQKKGVAPKDYETVPTYEAFKSLQKAEAELIEWGFKTLRKMPQYKKVAADLEGFKDKLSYHLEIRDKVIDLTMRLDASRKGA